MEQPRASVIIVTWNAASVLAACLNSVERQVVAGGFETIVVDNASTDSTQELLRGYAGRIRVISNTRNALYSGANNQAARVARGRVLFFLNSDTELLGTDVVERVAAAAERPRVGIAGPMLVNPDGTLQPSCAAHPTVFRALLVGAGLHRLMPDSARAALVPNHWSHDRPIETDWLMGAAVALRAQVFEELGGFSSSPYGQEQDLAYRARQKGLSVRFEPSARVMHVRNHSAGKRWSSTERAAKVAAAERAFLRAHYGRTRGAAIRVITGCAYAGRALVFWILRRREPAAIYSTLARTYAMSDPPVGSN